MPKERGRNLELSQTERNLIEDATNNWLKRSSRIAILTAAQLALTHLSFAETIEMLRDVILELQETDGSGIDVDED